MHFGSHRTLCALRHRLSSPHSHTGKRGAGSAVRRSRLPGRRPGPRSREGNRAPEGTSQPGGLVRRGLAAAEPPRRPRGLRALARRPPLGGHGQPSIACVPGQGNVRPRRVVGRHIPLRRAPPAAPLDAYPRRSQAASGAMRRSSFLRSKRQNCGKWLAPFSTAKRWATSLSPLCWSALKVTLSSSKSS